MAQMGHAMFYLTRWNDLGSADTGEGGSIVEGIEGRKGLHSEPHNIQ